MDHFGVERVKRQLVVKGVATPAMHATGAIDRSEDGAVLVWVDKERLGVDCCIDVGVCAATLKWVANV